MMPVAQQFTEPEPLRITRAELNQALEDLESARFHGISQLAFVPIRRDGTIPPVNPDDYPIWTYQLLVLLCARSGGGWEILTRFTIVNESEL